MQIPFVRHQERPQLRIEDVLERRTDLSTFVVHLTRDSETSSARENLESIIDDRTLRAGDPRGWATWAGFELGEELLETQRVVCFSETPLEHVHSLFADIEGRALQFRGYGIAFPKMVARWMSINPVWYVDMSLEPGVYRNWPIKAALNRLVTDARPNFAGHALSQLTPFIEGMGTFPDGNGGNRPREFAWEREWRHVGDLDLERHWSKALWLCPESEFDLFQPLLGDARCIDPAWGLERIIGHLLGMTAADLTPFEVR